MTGKVINRNPSAGLLILIIPIAFLMVLLFKAWPILLALLILSLSVTVWQHYRWKQWSKEVNPYFNQLIKENQGCLTPLDLSIKANLSGSDARRFLEKKSEEFGAQRQVYEDKGTVYYFLTASALGSIFDESEPLLDLEGESRSPQRFIETSTQSDLSLSEPSTVSEPSEEPSLSEDASSTDEVEEVIESPSDHNALPEPSEEPSLSEDASLTNEVEEVPESTSAHNALSEPSEEPSLSEDAFSTDEIEEALEPMPQPQLQDEQEDLWADQEPSDARSLIQAELAKRLDVHSSTVGKRKSDPDFAEWSQSRDPEGIAWEYSSKTKEFSPVEKPQTEN